MKTLKFRAWHKELKQMKQVKSIIEMEYVSIDKIPLFMNAIRQLDIDYPSEHLWSLEKIELMQWTGLQDTTGKDIYEGDIVNDAMHTISGTKNQYGIIRFGEHETSDDYYASTAYGFYIEYVNNPFGSTVSALDGNTRKDIILIGNIFQNSELLKEEQ